MLKKEIWLLMLLVVFAGGLRMYRLGDMDTRGDEVELLIPPLADFGPIQNFVRDFQAFKTGRILGLPRMTTSAMIKGFGLDVNRRNIRLPHALMGMLTIPALFLLGARMQSRRLAWILAFLATINPYLILYARQAHVYAFPLLFNAFTAAFAAGIVQALRRKEPPPVHDAVFLCVSSILACHSHMSSWPFVGLAWLLIFSVMIYHRKELNLSVSIRRAGGAFAIWVLSISPWIWLFISALFTAQESFLQGGGLVDFLAMWRLPFVMTWGGGPWYRAVLSIGLLVSGVVLGVFSKRWRPLLIVLLVMGVIMFGVMSLMMGLGGGFFQMRYYSPIWLVLNVITGLGVMLLAESLSGLFGSGADANVERARRENVLAFALCLLIAFLSAKPVWAVVSMPGQPSHYSVVNKWMDENLPKNTLVIVDRWFEPWNEMKYHAPENVLLTFTIPNEPIEVFKQYQWRETVKAFFEKYPDAAYFELVKQYFYVPEIGYWDWPREYFNRHVAFTNQQALFLRNAVLAPDGYYSAYTNNIVTELFYNTKEDIAAKALAEGKSVFALYGNGWGYTKLWQKIRGDFRDWRLLEKEAFIDVYNLTDSPLDVRVEIVAVAVPGNKQIHGSAGSAFKFEGQKIMNWQFDVKTLRPGVNSLLLRDPVWPGSQSALLVADIRVYPAVVE